MIELHQLIAALQAENKRLRGALERIAKGLENTPAVIDGYYRGLARAALEESK